MTTKQFLKQSALGGGLAANGLATAHGFANWLTTANGFANRLASANGLTGVTTGVTATTEKRLQMTEGAGIFRVAGEDRQGQHGRNEDTTHRDVSMDRFGRKVRTAQPKRTHECSRWTGRDNLGKRNGFCRQRGESRC